MRAAMLVCISVAIAIVIVLAWTLVCLTGGC